MPGTLYAISLAPVILICLFTAVLARRQRAVNGARWIAGLMLSVALWGFGQLASLTVGPFSLKWLFHWIMYAGIAASPVCTVLFVLEYYRNAQNLPRRITGSLFALPALSVLMLATNPQHHLFYTVVSETRIDPFITLTGSFGPWFWVHTLYSYVLLLISAALLVWHGFFSSRPYRRQARSILLGLTAGLAFNLPYILGILNSPVDLTLYSALLVGVVFLHSLYFARNIPMGPITKPLLYHCVPDGLLIVDNAGIIVEYNDALLTLFSDLPKIPLVGQDIRAVLNRIGYHADSIAAAIRDRGLLTLDTSDGWRAYQVRSQALADRRGEQQGTLLVFKNVTSIEKSLIQAEEALEAAQAARESKSRYLSDMSHEIRTPLTGILGAAQLLKEEADTELQADCADRIQTGARQLLDTVNWILDYSKLEAGRMASGDEVFCLKDCLTAPSGTRPTVVFTTPTHSRAGWYSGDAFRISQIWTLLLAFLGDSGTPTVQADVHGTSTGVTVQLSFRTEVGDADRMLDHLDRLDTWLLHPCSPNPLPLALALHLAEFLGGTVTTGECEEGRTLTLDIPLATVESPAPSPASIPLKHLSVLLADDSVVNQAVIARMLKAESITLDCASTGQEALSMAEAQCYDLILTDIHMPDISGIELSRRAALTANRNTPVVAMTADTTPELMDEIRTSPIQAVLMKPCTREQLIRTIQQLCMVKA